MILITGATGLLGFHLVDHLLTTCEDRLKLLIRHEDQTKAFPDSLKLEFAIGDVKDISSLESAFQGVNKVYHCAGLISFSPFDKEELSKINIEGTINVVNCCIDFNIEKLCHVSSVAAIGIPKDGNMATEETTWDPSARHSHYGNTKYHGELEVWRGIEEGLNAVIVNPSVILGPTDWNRSSMKLFSYVKEGNKYYTSGGNNFVDVRDVVVLMDKLMNSEIKSQRFIVSGERVLYKELFSLIANKLNMTPPAIKANKWLIEILWRLEHLKSLVFNTKPIITRETSVTAERTHSYSSQKIKERYNYQFKPIGETISYVVEKISPRNN